mmetsp:Transcript_10148/g.11781  ORF Transcript_10148/g.11781 Transcript_10148/m.11781 type:complete len:438 (+) Transcript_10148:83-1396(+)
MMSLQSVIPTLSPNKIKAFKAANTAMGELLTSGLIGATCIKQGFLNPTMIQSLSKTCFSVLLPMFLCSSIMKTVKSNGLGKSTIAIPTIAIIHCLTVCYISKIFILPIFHIDSDSIEGRSITTCCTFGNSGVIPLIFAEALFREPSTSQELQKAFSAVSLYLLGWSPLFWSFGRKTLLGNNDDKIATATLSNQNNKATTKTTTSKSTTNSSNMNTIAYKNILVKHISSLKSLFPPPVVGVFIGLTISSIPFLQILFMNDDDNNDSSSTALLNVVYNSVHNLGKAANPMALLVLTTSLALGIVKHQDSNKIMTQTKTIPEQNKNNKQGGDSNGVSLISKLSCVSVARFFISPLLMMSILNMLGGLKDDNTINLDKMTKFILILESCMPPAQNSVLMLQVANKGTEAMKLAKLLFQMYMLAMIPIVIISTLALDKLKLI